jgi:ABC-type sugar transport system ATPase subunit
MPIGHHLANLRAVKKEPIARLVDIVKFYGDTLALDQANLDLYSGEVLGLVGPNGSGKTTLTGILCGNIIPDSGEIWIGGREVRFASPSDAIDCGIRNLPQSLEIYPSLSVLENIFVGQEITRGWAFARRMDWAKMELRCKALLQRVGADHLDPRHMVSQLSGGQQKAVVIARLLATQATVLVFDEPAASLGVKQKLQLLDLFKTEALNGRSIVFITHDIEDVLAICTRVVVLRKGQTITDMERATTSRETLAMQMAMA